MPFVQASDSWATYLCDDGGSDDTRAQPNYSCLNTIENCRTPFGNLHMKIEWPAMEGDGQKFNEWSQLSNPTHQWSVDGYVAINAPFRDNGFGGLEHQENGPSYLDGTVNHGNWFYAVGSTSE